jgi:hypothetical protein
MVNDNSHVSDQDLLQLSDGELPALQARRIRAHLAACWNCRSRMAEMEGTIGEFVRTYRQTADAVLPPVAGSRAQLKARLSALAQSERRDPSSLLRFTLHGRLIAAVCAIAMVALVGMRFQTGLRHKPATSSINSPGLLPNPNLTPGATTAATLNNICSIYHDDVVRAVPNSLQQAVLQEYRMRQEPVADYEIDYLISPGLGGAEDIRNLWPEPRYNTMWNSFVKDQLEEYLHESVCSGQVSLVTAQRDMASDWVSAYKKYFHTDQPLQGNPVPGPPRVGNHSQKCAALDELPYYWEITLPYEPDRDNSL